ncbi:hypothetical protein PVAP13_9KG401365 [Panicum virgatum]|uniref:Uncharacterized protein n=1 Tax=Panicum virgatum TaxID=38727 RepID=A0A8T0NDL2_PANVG|nr:hypothetical protein PVAP13_9KG401365 [Panicum virgatum]
MDTEPFDEVELLALPASPAVSPPRRLKRLKKFSSQITTTVATTTSPPAGSPPPPSPPPPPPKEQASPGGETLAPSPSPPANPSPRPPTPAPPDADAPTPLPDSSPAPVSSPLPPTDTPDDEEDDGLDPLFSEAVGAGEWDPLGAPAEGDDGSDEEMPRGALIEELRRENSAKKRLDMDEADGGVAAAVAEAKGKRSKRKRKAEAPKESARKKKRSEKERRAQLDSIHAESQRLLRETRSASFRPIVQPVCKPISSVLEKIRLRKLEVLKKSNTTVEDDDDYAAASEPASDSVVHLDVPQVKQVTTDDKDLRIEFGNLDQCNVAEDENDLNCKEKDHHNHDTKAPDEETSDRLEDNHENTQSSGNHYNSEDQTRLPSSSSPAESADESSSEDEEDNDKENIEPSTQNNDVNTREHLQRAIGGDSCPDNAILKDFLDDEAEEEDDSNNDMMRFKDDEEDDGSDENEVFNDLIAAGYEEKEIHHEKRNELHQKWLQQQDAAETNNVMQRLKFGHQEQKESVHEDEDEDIEDCEVESDKEMSYDLTPANVVRQNSEKAKQMIAKMFTDDNDTYEHSDDEEIEEHLVRQRISKREVDSNTLISPLEDDSSREVFGLIKKLNIAPQPKKKGKQSTSNHQMLMAGRNSSTLKSSFLGRTASGSLVSSHRSVHRSYVFCRDDSNSSTRSCISTSEIISDMDQTNSSQPKKAKFSSSQPKPVGPPANSKSDMNSGVSLFEILRRTSSVTSDRLELSSRESCSTITESQAVHQFSAFKLSRRFPRVGARN